MPTIAVALPRLLKHAKIPHRSGSRGFVQTIFKWAGIHDQRTRVNLYRDQRMSTEQPRGKGQICCKYECAINNSGYST